MAGPSDTPSQSAAKKVPHLQLAKGGSGTTLQRHVNYQAAGGEVSGPDLTRIHCLAESD